MNDTIIFSSKKYLIDMRFILDENDRWDRYTAGNEISDGCHETNIIGKRIKYMVISLQSTNKESRIGACHGPEESTE
eukprot:619421-Ditylum_brightwellii.AAC.1